MNDVEVPSGFEAVRVRTDCSAHVDVTFVMMPTRPAAMTDTGSASERGGPRPCLFCKSSLSLLIRCYDLRDIQSDRRRVERRVQRRGDPPVFQRPRTT